MFKHIEQAIQDIQKGKMVLVTDDTTRENEGDLIMAAKFATQSAVNFMLAEARGLMCVPMSKGRATKLNLWPIVPDELNDEYTKCNFMVSVDALVSEREEKKEQSQFKTGVSVHARSRTIRALAAGKIKAGDFTRPGHTQPLVAEDWGVLVRNGHTEAAVDLCRLAGITEPVGVLIEILKKDGQVARLPYLKQFAKKHTLTMISIQDLISYRKYHEKLVKRVATAKLPTEFGQFKIFVYKEAISGKEHIALVKGRPVPGTSTLVRVHSRCLTGDIFSSLRCDCRPQLHVALEKITQNGSGVLVYLNQEGRDIGIVDKIKSYALQEKGLDTVQANRKLGHKPDLRRYHIGTQILQDLDVGKMELMTNNPKKIIGLEEYGLEIVKRIPLVIKPNKHNKKYLSTKRDKLGHLLH